MSRDRNKSKHLISDHKSQHSVSKAVHKLIEPADFSRLSAIDMLGLGMRDLYACAQMYHPNGLRPDEEKFVSYLKMAISVATVLAQYQASKRTPLPQSEVPKQPHNRSADELKRDLISRLVEWGMLPPDSLNKIEDVISAGHEAKRRSTRRNPMRSDPSSANGSHDDLTDHDGDGST